MSAAAADASSRWRGIVPATRWLRNYDSSWLRADVAAGVTLAAYLLPAALGDASLAGLPSEAGLYACLFGGLVFWLFCSSRQTSITVTSAISLLIGSSLGAMANGDPARYSALAACTALLVGAITFLTLKTELDKRGIAFRIVEARSTVRDMLRTEGVEEKVGRIDRFTMLADAIEEFQAAAPAKP